VAKPLPILEVMWKREWRGTGRSCKGEWPVTCNRLPQKSCSGTHSNGPGLLSYLHM
jgi:hypothetical protein